MKINSGGGTTTVTVAPGTALVADIGGVIGIGYWEQATCGTDAKAVARVRGLGFAGLLTQGAHHQAHHLAMARGEPVGDHRH